jgi:hypothetical protein
LQKTFFENTGICYLPHISKDKTRKFTFAPSVLVAQVGLHPATRRESQGVLGGAA